MTTALRIAWINNLYPPYVVGGNEVLAHDVIQALRARGHEVHVLTGHGRDLPDDGFTHSVLDIDLDHKEDLFLGGLPLTFGRVLRWKLFNLRSYRATRAKLAELRPDLVIGWNLYNASMAPLAAARGRAWPVVAHPADKWLVAGLWDVGLHVPANTLAQKLGVAALRNLVQPLLRRFAMPDYVLAVSEFIRRLHIERGFPEQQTLSTFLGVPTDLFVAQERPFPSHRPWKLIFAAHLWEGKGPQVAIEAVARLRKLQDLPPVTLDIYGSGTEPFIRFLEQKIADCDVQDMVTLHGLVPREQLAEKIQEGDVFLFCSIWDEPFSGGLLEALATGIPTIATATGGTPEAIRDGENGLLVPPDDPEALAAAIVRLMRDEALYQRIGQSGAADVRAHWTFEHYIDVLEQAYQAIVTAYRQGQRLDLQQWAKPASLESGGALYRKFGANRTPNVETLVDHLSFNDYPANLTPLPSVMHFSSGASRIDFTGLALEHTLKEYARADTYPLPQTADREGYHDDRHYDYWLSGLKDYLTVQSTLARHALTLHPGDRVVDFGCASGRVLRHFSVWQPELDLYGIDINIRHIIWILQFLAPNIKAIQNTMLPYLPFEDNSVNLLYAFSVFTHIDQYELAWLAEIRRVLKPGGVAYLTAHTDHTWQILQPGRQRLYEDLIETKHFGLTPTAFRKPMPAERLVFEWYGAHVNNTCVFHSAKYLHQVWGRFLKILEIIPEGSDYQDVILLKK